MRFRPRHPTHPPLPLVVVFGDAASPAHIHEIVTLTGATRVGFKFTIIYNSGLSFRRGGRGETGINVISSEWRISIYVRRRREGVHILIFAARPTFDEEEDVFERLPT